MRLFIDTSAFLAIEDADDKNHESALSFREELKTGRSAYRLLYTTNYVFDEAITLIRMQIGHSAAVSFGDALKKSESIRELNVTEKIDFDAWNIFKKYKDKDFSYTDCTSFAMMDAEEIAFAFAYDKHFVQYGFKTIP